MTIGIHSFLYNNQNIKKMFGILWNIDTDNKDINKQDDNGNTPLIWAVREGKKKQVMRFLQHPHIDVNIKNKNNECALSYACHVTLPDYDCGIIVELLKHPHIDVNCMTNCNGNMHNVIFSVAIGVCVYEDMLNVFDIMVKKKDLDVNAYVIADGLTMRLIEYICKLCCSGYHRMSFAMLKMLLVREDIIVPHNILRYFENMEVTSMRMVGCLIDRFDVDVNQRIGRNQDTIMHLLIMHAAQVRNIMKCFEEGFVVYFRGDYDGDGNFIYNDSLLNEIRKIINNILSRSVSNPLNKNVFDINSTNKNGESCMYLASKNGFIGLVQDMLKIENVFIE